MFGRASPVPPDDTWFELVVNLSVIDPADVVRASGFDPRRWKFLGPYRPPRVATYRVKLVMFNEVWDWNLDEVRARADAKQYRLLEGRASEPFRMTYPRPDPRDPRTICFGGSEWQDRLKNKSIATLVPAMDTWEPRLRMSRISWDSRHRWLVTAKEVV